MIRSYPYLISCALMLAAGTTQARQVSPHLQFSAHMDGAQEVPAVVTLASGVASLTLNATRDTLCIQAHWTGLSGPATLAHVHTGMTGISGPPLINLTVSINGDMLRMEYGGVTPELIEQLVTGALYINVHTPANPNGEIRGQLWPEADMALRANLNGAQEVPPAPTNAAGLGVFLLSGPQDNLHMVVQLNGLTSTVELAHLHTGAPGVDGPPVVDLFPYYDEDDNTIVADVDPTPFLADMLAGNIYINVHTTNFPGGEIRGQLEIVTGLAFDAVLESEFNVPPTENEGYGVARFKLTPDLDSLFYDVQLDSLSGPITMAHLHWGGPQTTGDVAVDLGPGIAGERITGWTMTAAAPDSLIKWMLGNALYINVHTALNPDGEIRGQVGRYWREGYSIDMSGAQEVPAVVSTAQGGGIASVDRDETNAHIMYVTNAANVTLTHLHLGITGEGGPVIHDLTAELSNNGVFTYWTSAEGFTLDNSTQFREDSIYANVHTAAFPTGEVRGQVHRGSSCDDFSTAVASLPANEFRIYPQPAHDQLTVMTGILAQPNMLLRNALGQRIGEDVVHTTYRGDRLELDISALAPGAYLLSWTTGGSMSTARFMKE